MMAPVLPLFGYGYHYLFLLRIHADHCKPTKATSGSVALDELYEKNWADAKKNDFIRAAYHDGQPALSSGTEQAEFFLNHGGRWIADNMTLAGILSIGAASVGDPCWGVNSSQTRQFIDDWVETYYNATDMWPYVHTDLSFFDECTDNWNSFPTHAHLGLIDGSDYPPDDHDLEVTYGVTWSLWEQREGYEWGGSSVMWSGDLGSLRYSTRQHDD